MINENLTPSLMGMWLFLAILVLVLVIFSVGSRSRKRSSEGSEKLSSSSRPQRSSARSNRSLKSPRTKASRTGHSDITVVIKEIPELLADLRENAERSFRVVGSSYWVEQDVIKQYRPSVFFLRREPNNEHDENAVAVYGGKRKFGYLSAGTAKQYTSLLDRIGLYFIVHRDVKDLARMSVLLPKIPVLRSLIENNSVGYWKFDQDELEASKKPPVPIPRPDKELTGGYPRIAGPHSNGDQVFGFYDDYAANLREAGTPTVSSLERASITPAIQKVRVGDRLPLKSLDGILSVSKGGARVGLLNWRDDDNLFDGGVVAVQRVFIGRDGKVVNCGGKVLPKSRLTDSTD